MTAAAAGAPGAPRLIVDIEKRLPGFALQVRLTVGTEILVLFGPSGAGKSTTLSAIAGLVRPDAGEIVLDGVPFFRRQRPGRACHVPARQRQIGYVFQHYALFPHLTVAENVAYALWRRADRRATALRLLDRMGIAHLADRWPDELSGGQQQRVAIARALAAGPRILLLDEPFSALDLAVRERLQRDLSQLQAELGLIVLYVTHRLEDAFAVGHRLAILREGRIEQVGAIDEVAGRPVNHAVASLLGIRNLFRARVVASAAAGLTLDWAGLRLTAAAQPVAAGATVTAYIRPEDVKVLYPDRPLMGAVRHNQVEGTVLVNRRQGPVRLLLVRLAANGQEIEVEAPAHAYADLPLQPGDGVQVSLRKAAIAILTPAPAAADEEREGAPRAAPVADAESAGARGDVGRAC
jgi:molybdate transport system ATP-binding protein